MHHLNIEIKARHDDLGAVRSSLRAQNADFIGEDHQVDTYFRVPQGRLKLREGPKPSDVTRYTSSLAEELKAVLTKALGVLVVVDKRREIYFIDNVKFHLDRVEHLGTFVEIEAIGQDAEADASALRAQCTHYMQQFGITDEVLVAASYSDLTLRREGH